MENYFSRAARSKRSKSGAVQSSEYLSFWRLVSRQIDSSLCQPRTQALHCFYRDQRQLIIQARKGATIIHFIVGTAFKFPNHSPPPLLFSVVA